MKKQIIATGIDTIGFEYAIETNTNDIELDTTVLNTRITYKKNGEIRIPFKPSICINGGVKPTGLKESLDFVNNLEDFYNIDDKEKGLLIRVDIATDLKVKLEDKIQLFRLFLETMAIKKRKEVKTVFETTKDITDKGNLKIKGRFFELTIYSCVDKAREANTRLEYKILEVRIKGDNHDKAVHEIERYIEDLKGLDSLIEKVEEKYINKLYQYYADKINKKEIKGFTEFVAIANINGWILTTDILKGLMKKADIKSSFKSFNQKYKLTRQAGIKTTTKTELKELINEIQKGLKSMLKNK